MLVQPRQFQLPEGYNSLKEPIQGTERLVKRWSRWFAEFGITPEVMLSFVHIEHGKVLSDFAEAVFKLPPKVYTLAYEVQDTFCDWAEAYRLEDDLDATDHVLAAFYNKVGDHALRLIGMLHLAQEFDLDAAKASWCRPSETIAIAVIELALEIMDLIVRETEAFHSEDSDLVVQLIAKVKASPAIDWKWSAIKGSCNQAIRNGGFELWKTAVFQMRESGIGKVTKPKPLTFRRHQDTENIA